MTGFEGAAAGGGGGVSPHPVDRLIRLFADGAVQTTETETGQILARIASAPFASQVVPVAVRYRGLAYAGRVMGRREPSLLLHLVRRVLIDKQWAPGTTADQYLADLHTAAGDPGSRIAAYYRTGQYSAAVLAPNRLPPFRRGVQAEAFMLVVYSADRGTITTGYQVSSLATVNLPASARWLR